MKPDAAGDDLVERDHWDSVWSGDASALEGDAPRRSWIPAQARAATKEYSEHALWDVLLPRHVPRRPGGRVVEIGSAPGTFLVRFAQTFGYEPWGIEYTASGAELNRQVFERAGYQRATVLEEDFFDDATLARHRGHFDVVVSRGFVEHFSDVHSVIGRHVELLKPGGLLVVAIPRFRGIYRAWMRLFDAEDLARHNLDIMQTDAFRAAFEGHRLHAGYCGPFGAISFKRFLPRGTSPAHRGWRAAVVAASMPMNALFRATLHGPGLDNRWLSPYLIYLGTRGDG
jgi:2-polyprenyl-3-methyl-5-hydroxy-6-metoxy-1,4-benzoquinol methylase